MHPSVTFYSSQRITLQNENEMPADNRSAFEPSTPTAGHYLHICTIYGSSHQDREDLAQNILYSSGARSPDLTDVAHFPPGWTG